MGAFWYRKALLMCDSLKMPYRKKISIYYGLSQGYLALRDYEQCDYYSELAGKNYADMFPDEKHFLPEQSWKLLLLPGRLLHGNRLFLEK